MVRPLAVLLTLCFLLPPDAGEARKRRKSKRSRKASKRKGKAGKAGKARKARRKAGPGRIRGQLKATAWERARARKQLSAYWTFGVPSLQRRRPQVDFRKALIFLDRWDADEVDPLATHSIRLRGATFEPPLLVVPADKVDITLQLENQDLLTHKLTSPESPALAVQLAPGKRKQVKLRTSDGIHTGRYRRFGLRSTSLPKVQGEIIFVCSTSYVTADARGRFDLKGIPKGQYTMQLYFQGGFRITKPVTVGRRALDLGTLEIPRAP